jgi:hypothetical protein
MLLFRPDAHPIILALYLHLKSPVSPVQTMRVTGCVKFYNSGFVFQE